MSWWSDLRERVRGLLFVRHADRELEEELRFHMDMDVEARMRGGLSAGEARRTAERAFGGVDRFREETRDARGVRPLSDFAQDVRYALRTLRRSPGFTLAAVLALGLGIGANTTIFSAVNAVVLRPLPFPQPGRLFMLWEENPEKNWYKQVVAPANMLDWRERVRAFQDVAGYTLLGRTVLSGYGEPQVLELSQVTGNFFSVLGVQPQLGRAFQPEETWQTDERVVVISHHLWTQNFAGAAGILNNTIKLDGVDYRVVGVMPQRFAFPAADVDVWLPTQWPAQNRQEVWFRRAHWLSVIARLQPGVSGVDANAQLQTVVEQLKVEYPATNRVMGAGLTPLHEFLIGDTRKPLLVLLAAVVLLLLIGCANVGNLLLVKAAGRQRELAVRSALGAGRLRLVRQMMTESLVLSLLGGAVGLLIGILGTRYLIGLQPQGLLPDTSFAVDLRVLTFVTLISLACGLIFGSVPALWTQRASSVVTLKEGGRSGKLGRSARALASTLVVAEVALALLLVIGAGLLVRSFQQLLRVDPGFDARGVLAVSINLSAAKYDSGDRIQAFFESLLTRAAALPGVQQVAGTNALPLAGNGYTSDFVIAGRGPDEVGTEVIHRSITPEYMRTMRVPLRRGRGFTDADRNPGERVVMINDVLARKFFPASDPVGQRIAFDRVPDANTTWYTIVGVAGSERQRGVAREPQIEALHPFAQARSTNREQLSVVLRTSADPLGQLPALKSLLHELDPNVPIAEARSMEKVRAESVARERFLMVLLLLFAGVALVLAVIGIHGVTAQFMRQRTQEIGVRLALGAEPTAVLRMMVGQGAVLVGGGIALGVAIALITTRAMTGLLFQVKPVDPVTFVGVATTLALAGLVAIWLPSRRASRQDPLSALRPD